MEPIKQSLNSRVACVRVRVGAGALLLGLGLAGCGGGQTATHTTTTARPPRATFARTVVLQPVSGKVLVEVPASAGAQKFVPLSSTREVPLGTVVNATAGKVGLTVATAHVQLRSGEFHGGSFEIAQPRAAGGLAMLQIHDNLPRSTSCPTAGGRLSQRILGLLRGTASTGFETVGKYSAATVLGTEWGVRDRCDGTFTVVQEGEVVVRDFRLRKNVVLHTGQTFLASAG